MQPAQMMAHCSHILEIAVGDKILPWTLLGRIIGPMVKRQFMAENPMPKNSPTSKQAIVQDEKDFATERAKLLGLVKRFSEAGPNGVTKAPHPFFGPMTPQEWGVGQYKHLDHHLKQFAQ